VATTTARKVAARKDYDAIAASKITSPTAQGLFRPRILVYGKNKKGKTRFCTTPGKGKVLIVDPEEGTKAMKRLDPDVWPISKWEDIDDVYNFLKGGNHNYEYVALDGMTRIHDFAIRWVMNVAAEARLDSKPVLVQKQHYGQAGRLTSDLITNFHNLPMGVIYTAQERMEASAGFDEEDDDVEQAAAQIVPALPKGARAALNQIVDVIGRIYIVKVENPKDPEKVILQRRLFVEPSERFDTGYRSDFQLPPFIKNPTVPRLMDLINTGKSERVTAK
jgi:hypothetical protein